MKKAAAAVTALALALTSSSPALAWGARGHEYVSNLAWALLSDTARGKVATLLGTDSQGRPISLATASVWPDCIRSVDQGSSGAFTYGGGGGAACVLLAANPAEVEAMKDYARRNWTQCDYAHRPKECHRSYHFSNVAIQHATYRPTWYGAGPQDVVQAIRSAILKLEKQPTQPPFDIKDEREALFMLAHFVGDLHQPLHMGSIYLTASGRRVNPDATGGDHVAQETAGGNALTFGSSNLHSDWDGISQGPVPNQAAICAALAVKPVTGALLDKPAKWGSESVKAARTAFTGVAFGRKANRSWTVTFADRPGYIDARQEVQDRRLVEAGARLAEVLNGLYPGTLPTHACP